MNKKNFLHVLTVMMVAMLCVGFISCGGDDGENTSGAIDSRILGTWYSTVSEGWDYVDGITVNHWRDKDEYTTINYNVVNGVDGVPTPYTSDKPEWQEITFSNDGTYYLINEEGHGYKGTFTTPNNNKINLYYNGSLISSDSYIFNEEGQLVVTMDEYDDGELESREIAYYNRGSYSKK